MPAWAQAAATAFGVYVTIADMVPPRLRYGYVHPLSRKLFGGQLPVLTSAVARVSDGDSDIKFSDADLVAALAADDLDVGGIGTVIEMLARALPAIGIRPVVVCPSDGARARRLRDLGIDVVCESAAAADAFMGADVIELHSAPPDIEEAAMRSGRPVVVAMHNTEIHFTRSRWRRMRQLLTYAKAGVAVSEIVRQYHAKHLPASLHERLTVVPNGAPPMRSIDQRERARARAALESAIGQPIRDEVIYVCLARYDAQKNISGMVSSFLQFAEARPDVRLVCAGDPSDWAEVRRADALRAASHASNQVHLLGNSDAATLLTAGDVFLLDSFFEGWPVAATEAAAAGLPLVLTDVGGAAELVARDPVRSKLVPNPCGDAAGVSDRLVASARRRSRRQRNSTALVSALTHAARIVQNGPVGTQPSGGGGFAEMAQGHAEVLRSATR